MCTYLLLVSSFIMHFTYLPVKAHTLIFHVPYVFIFYSIFTCPTSTSQWHFSFSKEEDKQILCLCLFMKNNVRNVAAFTCTERLTELQRFYLVFSVCQLGAFSIDQMKFISSAQGIRIILLQCRYSISDVETAQQ